MFAMQPFQSNKQQQNNFGPPLNLHPTPELNQMAQSFAPYKLTDLNWDMCWQDFGITPEQLSSLSPFQRVNHFLGTYNIARKNTLGIHLKKFKKEFPDDYNFFPHTWIWPSDMHELVEYNTRKTNARK